MTRSHFWKLEILLNSFPKCANNGVPISGIYESSSCPISSPALHKLFHFDLSYSSGSLVVSHFSLHFHFQITKDDEHLFMSLFANHLWWNVFSTYLPIFNWVVCRNTLYILLQVLCQINILEILSPGPWLSFSFSS